MQHENRRLCCLSCAVLAHGTTPLAISAVVTVGTIECVSARLGSWNWAGPLHKRQQNARFRDRLAHRHLRQQPPPPLI